MGQLEQITASAGSGKTYTLIRRFLELLAGSGQEGELALRELAAPDGRPHAWPEILAATFTNAAASEMKERLVRELKKYALAGGGKPQGAEPLEVSLLQTSSLPEPQPGWLGQGG